MTSKGTANGNHDASIGTPASELIRRFATREAVIGIIGLGYVGLPLVLVYARAGYRVLGLDVDPDKVERLNRGESYIEHITPASIRHVLDAGFEASADMTRAVEADALLLCVPTPLDRHREPDLRYVRSTMDSLAPHLRQGTVVSLESTTYPGTTEEELLPRIESEGWRVGKDVFLVYSPEREDPGNHDFDPRTIPKVIGGHTPTCLEVGKALYGHAVDRLVPVSSTRAAEMTKLLENIHRAVNIGLVNEMKVVADRMGIDIFEIIDAAATKPFGFTAFYPGPGLGGHCIPIDPFYLTWKAREYGVHTRFIELAGEVNHAMPAYVFAKLTDALNDCGKPVKGSRVLVLGLAYKKNVDDVRESPAVEILELLSAKGAVVDYSDPHVPTFPKMRRHAFDLESQRLTPETVASFDAVIIATDHDAFDYDMIRSSARLVVDARGRYRTWGPTIVRA